jgi:hypothetical protein
MARILARLSLLLNIPLPASGTFIERIADLRISRDAIRGCAGGFWPLNPTQDPLGIGNSRGPTKTEQKQSQEDESQGHNRQVSVD